MKFFDTHCHLNFHALENNVTEIIDRALKNNITHFVIPGAKIDSSEKAIQISERHSNCYAAVGIHPHHVFEIKNEYETIQKNLEKISENPKVIAIGEIGMDYHHYKNSPPPNDEIKKAQKDFFIMQLNIAKKRKLPVIIHCRWAQSDLYDIVSEFTKSYPGLHGVFHCFDGSEVYLKKVIDLGFYVGFDGNITYPENERLRDLVRETPLNRLVLETDAPFLTPQFKRGSPNEPAYMIETAKEVARIHSKPLTEISDITYQNAINLFQLQA